MSTNSTTQPSCPLPFLDQSLFSLNGGYVRGRLCAPSLEGGPLCCLPCPSTDWLYSDSFYHVTRIPGYISIVSLLLCAFMLLSFAVLPPEKTRRHYLNVSLVFSIFLFELGLTIPVLARPKRCYDAITPNDNTSNMTCAWSGAFIIAGGTAMNMWTFARALSMHLLICRNFTPNSRFHYLVHAFSWGVTAILLAVCFSITGVSFRFGDYCLVNHYKALGTIWAPLLSIAAVTMVIQLSTVIYCLHIYLRNLWRDRARHSNNPTSPTNSTHGRTARAVYSRVKQVMKLQWRSMAITSIMLVYVIYVSIVFLVLDDFNASALRQTNNILAWAACLVETSGDKSGCLSLAKPLAVNETTIIATLVLFAIIGIQAWLLIGRLSMLTAWFDSSWWRTLLRRARHEDSSDDEEQRLGKRAYEMMRSGSATGAGDTDRVGRSAPGPRDTRFLSLSLQDAAQLRGADGDARHSIGMDMDMGMDGRVNPYASGITVSTRTDVGDDIRISDDAKDAKGFALRDSSSAEAARGGDDWVNGWKVHSYQHQHARDSFASTESPSAIASSPPSSPRQVGVFGGGGGV